MAVSATTPHVRGMERDGVGLPGAPDLARAAGAVAGLGASPGNVSVAYLSGLATDPASWGPGRPLDGRLYNYSLPFMQPPEASAFWRSGAAMH
jgi:hypothetical protein